MTPSTSTGKILFASTSTAVSVQQAALALEEAGLLGAYYTTFGVASDDGLWGAMQRIAGSGVRRQLGRRRLEDFPAGRVHLFPWWEILRTALARGHAGDRLLQAVQTHAARAFEHRAARRVSGFSAVYAYNHAAEAIFRAAKRQRSFCIYGVRGFESAFVRRLEEAEYAKYPALRPRQSSSGGAWERREAKKRAEWDLADLVIVNSMACRDSYADAGYDMRKVRAVPLGCPEIGTPQRRNGPLRVLWAGNFSILKGAHYLTEALTMMPREERSQIEVVAFGKQQLPAWALGAAAQHIRFRGTVPRSELFEQYRQADVLILPTLTDAFGMVISEAMSQGLPVMTTSRAGAAELIRSGHNGIIIPASDAQAIATSLVWCSHHRESLLAMGIAARDTAANWQWTDFRKDLARVVSEALGQH